MEGSRRPLAVARVLQRQAQPLHRPSRRCAGPSVFPRGYRVEVSSDGTSWKLVAEGRGSGRSTVISFAPVQARFVRISLTETAENAPAWSIQALRVYGVR